ncbi:MAG: hypothetical protein PHF51_02565 [Candidatus ainarchaeum sp.]|nr:hypothetical protein [Candidatus ainarchaeum sp.]
MATAGQLSELLHDLRSAVSGLDVAGLRRVSRAAADATALDDGEETFNVALVSYMLSKLLSKQHYWDVRGKRRFMRAALEKIAACEELVKRGKTRQYLKKMHGVIEDMRRLELADERFVNGLEAKGRTKLAARLYAQGFSLSKAVALTSAHKRDLLAYSGRTLMADRSGRTMPLEERLKGARKVFPGHCVPEDEGIWFC